MTEQMDDFHEPLVGTIIPIRPYIDIQLSFDIQSP